MLDIIPSVAIAEGLESLTQRVGQAELLDREVGIGS